MGSTFQTSASQLLAIGILQGLAAGTLLFVTFYEVSFLPQKKQEHLFIFMLSSIFPSKVLASDKLKKYGMGGLVGALGTSLLSFYFRNIWELLCKKS